jgi:hypothetical protein
LRASNHLLFHLFELLNQPLLLGFSLFLVFLPLFELIKELQLFLLFQILFLNDALFLLFSTHFDIFLFSLKAVLNLTHLLFVLHTDNLLDLNDLLA